MRKGIAVALAVVGIIGGALLLAPFWRGDPANLHNIDDVHEFVRTEIIDVSREGFDSWELHYLDVTQDGTDELVLVSPLMEDRHPFLEIIRAEGRSFQRIPSQIRLTNSGTIPGVEDGFFTVTSTTSDSPWLNVDLDLYLYDGEKLSSSLVTVNMFRSSPDQDEVTGHLDGPLTDFTNTLLNIDPLRSPPVVRKGVYRYQFDPETKAFQREQLEEPEPSFLEIAADAQVNQTYSASLTNNDSLDTLELQVGEDLRLIVNGEIIAVPGIDVTHLESGYRMVHLEGEDGVVFVLAGSAVDGDGATMYFIGYDKERGAEVLGVIRSDYSLSWAPILEVHRDRAIVDYRIYSFIGGTWHVSEDEDWLRQNTDANIGGRFNLQGLTNEPYGRHWVPYDQYVGVILPFYSGVNLDQLAEQTHSFGSGGSSLSFAVFGTLHDTVVSYVENHFSDDEPMTKHIGTVENSLITIDAYLPGDSSYLRVNGMVYGGEGWENVVEFVLDDMRSFEEYQPIFIVY